jgi:hypothetical protein
MHDTISITLGDLYSYEFSYYQQFIATLRPKIFTYNKKWITASRRP